MARQSHSAETDFFENAKHTRSKKEEKRKRKAYSADDDSDDDDDEWFDHIDEYDDFQSFTREEQ